ncbi:MAG: pyridoxamine 5'-phosphate oxidase family protein [Candidatus Dormibacteraceae bacterium]
METEEKIRSLIVQYLSQAKLMQLATSVEGQPWACSVWFAADDQLNLYFFSSEARRHSKEVLENPRVAGAIALPHEPKDPARGVQFEGIATLIDGNQGMRHARACYEGRIFSAKQIDSLLHHPDRPHRFYKISPTEFVLFDALNFPNNSRQQWSPNPSGGNPQS